jgi:hypothetical protein
MKVKAKANFTANDGTAVKVGQVVELKDKELESRLTENQVTKELSPAPGEKERTGGSYRQT